MASMDLDTYKKALEDKSEVPSFAPAVKTQYSRNITIEDWNSVIYSVQGLLSDVSATSEFLMDNTAYQLQYSSTNVRGYYNTPTPNDVKNLAEDQLYFAGWEGYLRQELLVAYGDGEGGHSNPLGVGVVGNRPYFVYTKENLSEDGAVQNVGTGLCVYYTGTDGGQVNYGTNPNEFYVSVTDKNNNYSGAISLGAKTYKFAYDSLVDVFSSDGNTTAIKSPMGSASVSLTNGQVDIVGTTIYYSNDSTPTNHVFKGMSAAFNTYNVYFNGGGTVYFTFGSAYFQREAPYCLTAPTSDGHLANKAYVDSTAEAQATEKANAEQTRAEKVETTLQKAIDAINASQNFVATYATEADLPVAPTSGVMDGDCALVLKDSTHNNQSTVYKWTLPYVRWIYVGELGDYYTKAQINEMHTEMETTCKAYSDTASATASASAVKAIFTATSSKTAESE